nr:hypothetical protein [Ardenticatenales bacterium]
MRNLLRLLWLCLFLVSTLAPPLYAAARLPESTSRPDTLRLTLTSQRPHLTSERRADGLVTTFEGDLPLVGPPGAPALPVVGRLVGLPTRARPTVTIHLREAQPLPRPTAPLARVPSVQIESEREGIPPLLEWGREAGSVSEGQGWYPAAPVTVGEPMTMRGQAMVQVAFTPVQVNLATGELRWYPSADIELSWEAAQLPAASSIVEDPSHEPLLAATLSNYEEARGWRSVAAGPLVAPQAAGDSWMIAVEGSGLFRVPYEQLASATVPLSDPDRLALFHGSGSTAEEQAIWLDEGADNTFGPGDALYFINTRLPGRWSKQSAYRLEVLTSGTGQRMAEVAVPPTQGPLVTSVSHEVRFEEDTLYMQRNSGAKEGERWYWKQLAAFAGSPGDPASIFETTFDLPHMAATNSVVRVTTELGPLYTRCHLARLLVNGRSVEKQWTDMAGFGQFLDLPQSELQATGNTFRVEAETCGTAPIDFLMLNSFTVLYQRALVVSDDILDFYSDRSGSVLFQLAGLTTSGGLAFEVGTPGVPQRIIGGSISGSGPYSLTFGRVDAAGERYLVTTRQQAQAVDSITRHEDSGLRTDLSPADYLIITHPAFAAALQPLVEH